MRKNSNPKMRKVKLEFFISTQCLPSTIPDDADFVRNEINCFNYDIHRNCVCKN